jgi:membrane fusion protein (multidrug efflux system)
MATPFSRTLRSLEAEGTRPRRLVWAASALLLAWGGWFGLARVTLYEVSDSARLEAPAASHPVAAVVPGRVTETRLALGRACAAGDVLLVLDAEPERLAAEEKRARARALGARREALGREARAEREALEAYRKAQAPALEEARAQASEAEARVRYAAENLAATERLWRTRAVAELDLLKSRAEADAARASAKALRSALARVELDRLTAEHDRRTRLSRLEKEAVELEGEQASELAAARRLGHEVERRTVRAPIDGRVAEVREVRPGSVLAQAETVARVVPVGRPRAVAFFPARALGRLRPGQAARLRLEGFPWTQYGSLPAAVSEVGQEASDGRVRVELALDAPAGTRVPLEHGVPGSAEVAVEEVSPAALVLRAVGGWLTGQRTAAAPAVPGGP